LLLFVVMGLALCAGCGTDDCDTLCTRTASRLATCLESWSASWEDLGASNRSTFRRQCENDWAMTRADLEPREVRMAVEGCEDALDVLAELEGCDELRALYLD